MSLAKVWNDGPSDYREDFRGTEIHIPKGSNVEMDQFDAVAFLGQYIPIRRTGNGVSLNHKQLRIETLPEQMAAKVEYRCQMCRGLFQSENELVLHSEAFHKGAIVADLKKPK